MARFSHSRDLLPEGLEVETFDATPEALDAIRSRLLTFGFFSVDRDRRRWERADGRTAVVYSPRGEYRVRYYEAA